MTKPFRAKHHIPSKAKQVPLSNSQRILLVAIVVLLVPMAAFVGYKEGVKEGLKMEPTEVLMDLCLHGTRIIHEGKWWEVACFPKSD